MALRVHGTIPDRWSGPPPGSNGDQQNAVSQKRAVAKRDDWAAANRYPPIPLPRRSHSDSLRRRQREREHERDRERAREREHDRRAGAVRPLQSQGQNFSSKSDLDRSRSRDNVAIADAFRCSEHKYGIMVVVGALGHHRDHPEATAAVAIRDVGVDAATHGGLVYRPRTNQRRERAHEGGDAVGPPAEGQHSADEAVGEADQGEVGEAELDPELAKR
eukprot:CAMPEP_0182579298 /NCGR_PEP_ID=MMETSP1324-20130603/43788_1 /TAXON_ID=236786 /ORGANISM="Florenciella sp., Strain RCC1587" /LENGTH=217 /DNA_ID=CAMNT_0024795377 /DNA_START=140 /DNA_END=794 /DNA_ORIENTATION=-